MTNNDHVRQFRLHFEGPVTQNHSLPAAALVNALQQMQRIVHLLAMSKQKRTVRHRARITRDIEKRYQLLCRVPEEGGYALPLVLGDTTGQLCDAYGLEELAKKTKNVILAVNEGNSEQLLELIPESYYRNSVLTAFSSMQQPRKAGVVISIEDFQRQKLLVGKTARDNIDRLIARPEPDVASTLGYITGELIEMKFQDRRLKLKLLGSGRALEASYRDDFEPILLEHPRELIQVYGNIVFGDDGIPASVSEVEEILEVDDSPIEIFQLEVGMQTIKPKTPMSVSVQFNQELGQYELDGPFGIVLGAETRPVIETQLFLELAMLWREYVEIPDDMLTSAARRLRDELIASFEVVADAS